MTRPRLKDEHGFTVVEVMVAAMLLLVGLLGTLTLVERAGNATVESGQRESATSLAREVLEKSRAVTYADLTGQAVTDTLSARPELATARPGTWTVVRRGAEFVVAVDVCALDDAVDGYGARTSTTFCAGQPAAGVEDAEPVDFKRVAVRVSYSSGGATRQIQQVSVRTSRRGADAPRIQSILATSPAMADPAAPIVSSAAVTSVGFAIVAGSKATAVTMSVDGVDVGPAISAGNSKDWTFTLPVGTRADGTYEIGARAKDARGVESPTVSIPLLISRTVPPAPDGLEGGRNEVVKNGSRVGVVELDWLPAERSVVGFRVYRPDGTLACPSGGPTVTDVTTSCIDFAPQTGVYGVASLYRDAAGALRESARSTVTAAQISPGQVFYLRNTQSSYSGSGCGTAKVWRDLVENYPGVDPGAMLPSGNKDDQIRFCSPVQAAVTIPSGTTTISVWLTNTQNQPCPVTFSYVVAAGVLGSSAKTVPAFTTTPVLYEYVFTTPSYTLGGKQISVLYSTPGGAACDKTDVNFSGTIQRSRVQLAGWVFTPPAPPSALTATRRADGSVDLTWAASPDPAVTSYRIYRDGAEVTDRFDRTGDASTAATDPNREGTTHVYRVTAVRSDMGESLPTAPVTG